MQQTNTLIVNDGIGVDIATWLIHREKFPENLNGTDFIPHYLNSVKDKGRVYLFGAKPGIAVRAAQKLTNEFSAKVVGTCDGYEQAKDSSTLIADMNASGANIILVAMGNPAQEKWILDHRHQLNASVFIGVGALLDFLAGDKPRAPRIIQKLRLEWFYRLCLEPTRLMRRYTIDIAVFLALCLRTEKWRKSDAQCR
jgi:beta-1,4-glucosyltransferase